MLSVHSRDKIPAKTFSDEYMERVKQPKKTRIKTRNNSRLAKSFSDYKISHKNDSFEVYIIKKIIYILDKLFVLSEDQQHRIRNLLNEADIWGVPDGINASYIKFQAEEIAENLIKEFDNEDTVYLLIHRSPAGESMHASLFLGNSSKADVTENYISWTTINNYIYSDCCHYTLQEDIEEYGYPEVIPIPNLNILAMKERWKDVSNSRKKYSLTKLNCSFIAGSIIDAGLNITTSLDNAPFLYSPSKLRKRGLELFIKGEKRNDSNDFISSPLNMRKIPINNQEEMLEEYKFKRLFDSLC